MYVAVSSFFQCALAEVTILRSRLFCFHSHYTVPPHRNRNLVTVRNYVYLRGSTVVTMHAYARVIRVPIVTQINVIYHIAHGVLVNTYNKKTYKI